MSNKNVIHVMSTLLHLSQRLYGKAQEKYEDNIQGMPNSGNIVV